MRSELTSHFVDDQRSHPAVPPYQAVLDDTCGNLIKLVSPTKR
jgi:hypothetical protein